jgi:hypothetical protein
MINYEKKLSIKVYKHCYALPSRYFKSEDGVDLQGGGLCCDDVWIKESGLFPSALAPYLFDNNNVKHVDEDVVFIGCMSPVWGHAITDCLKHIWWLRTEEYKRNHKEKRLIYWGSKSLAGNFLKLLEFAEVDVSKLQYIDRPSLFKSVIVPDISFNYTEEWASQEYMDTIDLIISNSKPRRDKNINKIFLSERESHRLLGVKSIEKVARNAGYTIYYPGEHPLEEQISVFQSASTVLSFESSIGHNTVFCHPRIKLIMLRKDNYSNKYQPIINQLRLFDNTTIDASLSIMNDKRYPYAGPFFVYPNEAVCKAILSNSNNFQQKHEYNGLFPKEVFKRYIEYNLYGSEDALAHKFVFSETQAKCLAHEITQYKDRQYEKTRKIFKYVLLPNNIKERIIRKFVKYKVRHFI